MLSQLSKDIEYCIQQLGCTNEQTDELIGAATTLGVNAEYFCEEFIFQCDTEEELDRLHDDNYLTINWGLS